MKITQDKIDQANELLGTMKDAMDELDRIFRQAGGDTYARWKAYPKGHITMALSDDHEYLGSSMCTVEELIKDLDEDEDLDED